jgi:hypothetical protein
MNGPKGLGDYEPVEERLAKFWKAYPTGRVATELVAYSAAQYIVRAEVYRDIGDPLPFATGFAEEQVGVGMVNKTSALENGETSAIGRALANGGFAPKGARPSREEMTKASRAAADVRALARDTVKLDKEKVERVKPDAPVMDGWSHGQKPPPPPVSAKQLGLIGKLFTDAGVTDRAARLKIVSDVVGRTLTTSKDLTVAEASALIDHLGGGG